MTVTANVERGFYWVVRYSDSQDWEVAFCDGTGLWFYVADGTAARELPFRGWMSAKIER